MVNFIVGGRALLPENNLSARRLLNVGCGTRLHADWVNADIAARAPGVIAIDLRRELPFPAASFEAVYCSHVLEHLSKGDGAELLGRLHRILRPGGVLRVVVPDLEAMVREYLAILDALERGEDRGEDHDWIMLEMYDQFSRRESGGEMGRYLANPERANAAFVRKRIGEGAAHSPDTSVGSSLRKIAGDALGLVLGRSARDALQEGFFRQSGEVHRWMYDGYSLRRALEGAAFREVRRCTAHESRIADFARYRLDVDAGGRVRKPDSLFMEGQVP
jgi:predicted SAM-dependent methyltransferase